MRNLPKVLSLALALLLSFAGMAQEQSAQVASQGGGFSSGGSYSQFVILGGEPVASYLSGGSYTAQAGFLFRSFDMFEPWYVISGTVRTPEGNPLASGTISLMVDNEGSKTQLSSVSLGASGNFSFAETPRGFYTLKIVPAHNPADSLPLLSTYLGATQLPAQAQVFELKQDTLFANLEVLREQAPDTEWIGEASITGILVEDKSGSTEGGRLMSGMRTNAGTPMAGAQIFLTDPASQAVKFSRTTDAEGMFSFQNIAHRAYGFLVEYQGKSYDMAETVDLSSGNSAEVTAVVSEEGLSTSVVEIEVTGVDDAWEQNVRLYPNPVQDRLQLSLQGLNFGTLEIMVFDRQGKIVRRQSTEIRSEYAIEQLDVADLPQGLYLLQLRQQDLLITRKLVKH